MRNQMTMQHQFSQVPQAEIPRSQFNRSFNVKTTFDSGYLVPIMVDEVLPGDTFNCRMSSFVRMTTPLTPIMDNLYLDTFFFFVPLRLIWTNFQKFMGAQDNPGDSTSYVCPIVTTPAGPNYYESGTLFDYFGVPVGVGINGSITAFASRAYNLIWNEWFRDQNLQNSVTVDKGDGPDTASNYVLKRRGKRHDYFTSALPWPQKGTAVSVPLGTSATVKPSNSHLLSGVYPSVFMKNTLGGTPSLRMLGVDAAGALYQSSTAGAGKDNDLYISNLYADLSTATAATINQLRQAFQLQKLYERDARGGTRYTEIIRAHFGVTSPDARLQRPEYLGGGTANINFNAVPQTSATGLTGGTTPSGNLAAFATGSAVGHGFTKGFTEHGIIIGLANVRADLNYQQGLDRMWSRSTKADFYWPALAQIGEQTILNKEIYAQGTADDLNVFGYQERYAEYRYKPSIITGKFRSQLATPIDQWHLAQEFTALPTLNSTFIEENPPVSRVVAVTTEPQFMGDFWFKMITARPMPVYGVPGNIDRF